MKLKNLSPNPNTLKSADCSGNINSSSAADTCRKVIFDMDGLIFDSERLFMQALGKVMAEYGYTLTEENYIKMLGLTKEALSGMVKALYGADYPHDEISSKARSCMDKIARTNGLPVKKGIKELLAYLKKNNISCSVASSTQRKYVELYLETAGLSEFFSDIIGGDMVEKSKPNPDIFLAALGNISPKNALVLEDSKNGILAAYRAGIPVICIPDMTCPDEETAPLLYAVANSAEDVIKYFVP